MATSGGFAPREIQRVRERHPGSWAETAEHWLHTVRVPSGAPWELPYVLVTVTTQARNAQGRSQMTKGNVEETRTVLSTHYELGSSINTISSLSLIH